MLRQILWADLWDFLRAEQVSITVAHVATAHPALDEALEMHLMLMEKIAEISWEHGEFLGKDPTMTYTPAVLAHDLCSFEEYEHAVRADAL